MRIRSVRCVASSPGNVPFTVSFLAFTPPLSVAVLLPVQTVGVMGDARTYDFVCGLRAVTSTDGMTADFYPYDMEFLGRAQWAVWRLRHVIGAVGRLPVP